MGVIVIDRNGKIEAYPVSQIDYAIVNPSGEVEVYIEDEMKKLKNNADVNIIKPHLKGRVLYREKHFYLIETFNSEELKEQLFKDNFDLRKILSDEE